MGGRFQFKDPYEAANIMEFVTRFFFVAYMIVENDHYSRSQAVVCHAFDRSRIPGRKIWGERGSEWRRAGVAASFFCCRMVSEIRKLTK